MGRHYGIPTNDFRDTGSRIAGVLGWPFRALWWLIKAALAILIGGIAGGAGLSLAVLGIVLKTLFCSLFVWQGWNRGLVDAAGLHPIGWTTAFWCSLVLVPLFMTSSKSES